MKRALIIDFDNTIAKSAECIISLYQAKTRDYSKKYKEEELQWDFSNIIPEELRAEYIAMFGKQRFYDNLEPMENAIEVMRRLSENYEIIICTKHDPDSISMKQQWIRNHLDFPHRVVYLVQNDFNKEFIGDFNSIIIDDKVECLVYGNRALGIIFGNYAYNQYENLDADMKRAINRSKANNTPILRCANWLDIEKMVNLY